MKNISTAVFTALMMIMAFTSCSKEKNMPEPAVVVTPSTPTCSNKAECLQATWRVDSVVYYDINNVYQFHAVPSNYYVMQLNPDGSTSNGNPTTSAGHTYTYGGISNDYITTTDGLLPDGFPIITGNRLQIYSDSSGTNYHHSIWFFTRI